MTDTHELAWAAGFFDGEGYTGFRRGNRHSDPQRRTYMGLTIPIGQKTPELLYRFQAAVGVGQVYGPYKNGAKGPNATRTAYRYAISNIKDIRQIRELLSPYLGEIKRQQMNAAISGWETAPRLSPGPISSRNLTRDSLGHFQLRHGQTYP